MTTTPNMQTVLLLADLQVAESHPSQWSHLDGSPLTAAEIDIVMTATTEDMRATATVWELRALEQQGIGAMYEELMAIVAPAAAAQPKRATLGELMPLLPADERLKATSLIHMIQQAEAS